MGPGQRLLIPALPGVRASQPLQAGQVMGAPAPRIHKALRAIQACLHITAIII